MNHTPGPWKLFDGYGASRMAPAIVDSIPDVDGKCVANCICYLASTNLDCASNALLITLAPKMLAAIEGALRIADLWRPTEVQIEHHEEAKALQMMLEAFEEIAAHVAGETPQSPPE